MPFCPPISKGIFKCTPSGRVAVNGHSQIASRYCVTKISPKGQLTIEAVDGGASLRLTTNGNIIGVGQWDRRRVVSAKTAAEIMVERWRERSWINIETAAKLIQDAARGQDPATLESATAALAQAIKAQRAATLGAVEDESAVASPCAQ